ncbi:MAG: formylmethanofuran dehydrogenase subunit B [Candidatus Thorarchaeota archaeon]
MTEETHENVVCVFCGCLCDDIKLEVKDNKITSNENGCAISKAKFLHHAEDRLGGPSIRTNGTTTSVSLKEAVSRAVDLIANSKRLLVYGLSSTENDAHREAYKIAEEAGGVVDNTSSVCHGPTILGAQESGEAVAALAEVRHRSDLVIYWGSNPQFAHPRHMNLHTRAAGEYIKDPKKERKIWVIDIRKTISAGVADKYIQIEPGTDLEVISALRALARGKKLDVDEVGGQSVEDLKELVETMKTVKYGVLFFGLGLTQSKGRHRNIDAAIRLIQDLNRHTKWSMLPMRGHYNVAGANKTSTWQTGYPYAVDYSRGYPRYQPGEFTAVDMLVRSEVDVLLNIAADPAAHFPREALKHMANIPIINLDPKQNMTSLLAEVNIPTAIAGIECDGAATRMDGLPLYLKKVVDPPEDFQPDREILKMIYSELRRVKK